MHNKAPNNPSSRGGLLASRYFRISFTLLLVVFVYTQLDVRALVLRIQTLTPYDVLLFCCLYFVSQLFSTLKWILLLIAVGIRPKFFDVAKAYLLGMFVNTFGLGTVGGDLTRAMAVSCENGQRGYVLATVLADRIHGLCVLLLIGLFSIAFIPPDFLSWNLRVLAFGVSIAIIMSWFLGPWIAENLVPRRFTFRDKLVRALDAFPRSATTLGAITGISVSFHLLQIYLGVLIFQRLGAQFSFLDALPAIPFINGASALPISINGLGVRETVSMYLLFPLGIENETAVAFSGVWLLIATIVSALGGVFLMFFSGETFAMIKKNRWE